MIAWITTGPIMDDATVDKPKSPKNYIIVWEEHEDSLMLTHHVFIPGWGEFSHHRLGKSIERCLENSENDIVRPIQKISDKFQIRQLYIPILPDIMEAIKKLV